jgi:dipeptidyl-peptidase 4
MNKLSLLISLFLIVSLSFAQHRAVTVMVWQPDGNSFLSLDRNKVVKTELPSMTQTTLYDFEKLLPAEGEHKRKISSFNISDDQERIMLNINTITKYHKTTGECWIYNIVSGKMQQLGKGLRTNGLMYTKFSPVKSDKAAYVYQNKEKGKVVYNLYVENLNTGKVKQLTFDTRDRSINGTFDWVYSEELFCLDGFRWSPDGTSIAYWNIDASKVRNYLMLNTTDSIYPFTVPVEYPKAGEDPSPAKIGVVNIATAITKWMNIEGDTRQNYLTRMEWSGNKELIIQQLNRKQNVSKIILADISTGKCRTIWTDIDETWIDVEATWNTNDNRGWNWIEGKKAFVWASEKDGWRHLYHIRLDGKESLITKGDYDVIRIYTIDEKNNFIYFAASSENATQQYLYRIRLDGTSKAERLTPSELTGMNDYSISPKGNWAMHSFSSHLYVPASEWISLPDNKPLYESTSIVKNLKADPFGKQINFFKITTEDGISLDGWIAKPKDFDSAKKYPVIFYVYGEPWGSTVNDKYGIGKDWQLGGNIVDEGYLLVAVDNRGSTSARGREWRKSIYRNIGKQNIRDMAMAAKEVLKWDYCDTARVAVHGWSGGGSSTLNLMFQYPKTFKTGIAVAAVGNQLAYDNTYQERYMGIPQETRADYIAGSPYTYAKNLEGNLLYIHGTGDDNVHYANAEILINELVKYNKPFQMMAYPMRSHSINEGEGTTQHLITVSRKFLHDYCPAGGK